MYLVRPRAPEILRGHVSASLQIKLDAVAATPSTRCVVAVDAVCSRRVRGKRLADFHTHRMGKIATRSELSNRYGVKVKWLSELQDHCASQKCYVPRGRNSDSWKEN